MGLEKPYGHVERYIMQGSVEGFRKNGPNSSASCTSCCVRSRRRAGKVELIESCIAGREAVMDKQKRGRAGMINE